MGIDAEATRQATRGEYRSRDALWLANSESRDDRVLAKQIVEFVKDMPMMRTAAVPQRDTQLARAVRGPVAAAAARSSGRRENPRWAGDGKVSPHP